MKLPAGPGAPATDANEVFAEAIKSCRGIRTFSAEVRVTGKVNGERLRGSLLVGAAVPAKARIEAVAPFGAPAFILAADQNDATLLLPRDNRVLEHGRPDEILAALTGVPLTADELRLTLTGCWTGDAVVRKAEKRGEDWRTIDVEPDHVLNIHRDRATAHWRIVSIGRNYEHSGRRWAAAFSDFQNDLPRFVRIFSQDSEAAGTYDLSLTLSQVESNVELGPEVFRVDVPRGAQPITIDELRHAGPGVRKD